MQAPATATDTPILRLERVAKQYRTGRGLARSGAMIQAVSGVDLAVAPGEVVSIVGESGCGKSTLTRMVLGLEQPDSGQVFYEGVPRERWRSASRGGGTHLVQAVFQDPWASLNPRMRIGAIIAEPLRAAAVRSSAERRRRVQDALELVGLDRSSVRRYPHEFSGGQRQRIAVARSLVTNPRLVVLDEPVSSLDVSIRAQIINLLQDVRDDLGTALLMVSHDLATVRYLSDRVAVMYMGRLVEVGSADAVFTAPLHPYTQLLLEASKPAATVDDQVAEAMAAEVPSPTAPPSGCRFRTRCPHAMDVCAGSPPPWIRDPSGSEVACYLHVET